MGESEKTLTGFREELTCSICKKLFKEPKTLSCLHTFCEECLSKHIKKRPLDEDPAAQDGRENVPCPLCKHVHKLDSPDVSLVKTNLGYKNMVEHLSFEECVRAGCGSSGSSASASSVAKCDRCDDVSGPVAFCKTCNERLCEKCRESHGREKNLKSHPLTPLDDMSSSSFGEKDSQMVTHYTWKCEKHQDKDESLTKVQLYCETCDKMICMKCSIVQPHGNHDKFEAEEIINNERYKPRIVEHEKKVEGVEEKFTNFIAEMKELQEQLEKHQKYAKEQIDERVKDIHKKLEVDKKELLVKVDQIFNSKNVRLEEQIKELEAIEKNLKSSRKVVNDTLEVGIPAEILFLMTQFIERLQFLFDEYDNYDRRPRENDILKFTANEGFDFGGAIGIVETDPFPSAFTVDDLESVHFIEGIRKSVTVTCRDIANTPCALTQWPNIKDIKVELHLPPNGDAVLGHVEKDAEKGEYTVQLQPASHGEHELKIEVVVGNEEKHIPIKGSPFKVKVSRPVTREITPENKVIPDMQHPSGVAVKCAVKHNVREGDGEGGEGEGGEGRGDGGGVVEGAGRAERGGEGDIIAISDVETHRIAVITNNDFQHPKWIGEEGDGDLQFNSPRGIAFDRDGHVAVVEKENSRVQVVSVEGEFKYKFGKKGLGNGEFERPTDIVINADGIMFVSDSNSNRIQYFTGKGEFLGFFGKHGPLNTPYAVACDGLGRILITERAGNRVQCWKRKSDSEPSSFEGEDDFECVLKSTKLSEPVGIAYHPDTDYIIVTEMKEHRLSIFDKNLQLIEGGVGANLFTTPIGVGVLGDSRVIVCDCGKNNVSIFNIVQD